MNYFAASGLAASAFFSAAALVFLTFTFFSAFFSAGAAAGAAAGVTAGLASALTAGAAGVAGVAGVAGMADVAGVAGAAAFAGAAGVAGAAGAWANDAVTKKPASRAARSLFMRNPFRSDNRPTQRRT